MKIAETKIYIKFVSWFILVSALPLAILFLIIYIYFPNTFSQANESLIRAVLVGLFVSLAAVLSLSLLAARRLARSITKPIFKVVEKINTIVTPLSKSVDSLSHLTAKNKEVSAFLLNTSRDQQKDIKSGNLAISQIVKLFSTISHSSTSAAADLSNIDTLAEQGSDKSQKALASLSFIKQLSTDNQKLSQAIENYNREVKAIATRMESLAETVKYLSLNISIEANKSSFGEDFSSLVSQIRELNISSQQAALSIGVLAQKMQEQIQKSQQSSHLSEAESAKTVSILDQTIKFLAKIVAKVSNISTNVQDLSKQANNTENKILNFDHMLKGMEKESKTLVKFSDNIVSIINDQMVVSRALEKTGKNLRETTDILNDLVKSK